MLSHGEELNLVQSQFRKKVGVFACDAFTVFSDVEVELGDGMRTAALPSLVSPLNVPGALTASWVNRAPFAKAWDQVAALEANSSGYDWVVKVDPDTVFFPMQLRLHLRELRPEVKHSLDSTGVYLRNCMAQTGELQFYGSTEVLSQTALRRYAARGARCRFAASAQMGEDLWMQQCLDVLKVTAFQDAEIVADGYCPEYHWQPAQCTFGRAAYHPLKSESQWWTCWQQVTSDFIVLDMKLKK